MVEEWKANGEDARPHPTQQEDVPQALDQKELVIERLKEQRESLEKCNQGLRTE